MTSSTSSHPLRLTHIGGPTVLIEIGSFRILTDPTFDTSPATYVAGPYVLRKKAGPMLTLAEIGEIDAVLLSHDQHIDNLDTAGRAMLPHAKRVFTTPTGAQRLGSYAQGVPKWETITLTETDNPHVRITSTPARHGPPELEEAMGEVTGWIVQWEGQEQGALYISGDTVLFDALREIPQRFQIGIALLHFGAAGDPDILGPVHLTLTAREGVALTKLLGDATIIPIHYDGWAHLSEGRTEIQEAFENAHLTKQLRFLPPGTSIPIDA